MNVMVNHDANSIHVTCQTQIEEDLIPKLVKEMQERYSSDETVRTCQTGINGFSVRFPRLPKLFAELKERFPYIDEDLLSQDVD